MIKSKSLHIIIDASGSMQEMGKLMLARNLISYIRESSYLMAEEFPFGDIYSFLWNDGVYTVDLLNDNEIPCFNAAGKIDMDKLVKLLEHEVSAGLLQNLIILSDGNFSKDAIKTFCLWRKENPDINVHTVSIGADASSFNLKELATNKKVIHSEDISTIIQSFYYGNCSDVPVPHSIVDINLAFDAKGGEFTIE